MQCGVHEDLAQAYPRMWNVASDYGDLQEPLHPHGKTPWIHGVPHTAARPPRIFF